MNDFLKKSWYVDSESSKHMTRDVSKFTHISLNKIGHVTYGDNNKDKILGIGKISTNPFTSIKNVLLVDGLKHGY